MPRRGRLRRAFNRATGRLRRNVAQAGEGIGNFLARTAGRLGRR